MKNPSRRINPRLAAPTCPSASSGPKDVLFLRKSVTLEREREREREKKKGLTALSCINFSAMKSSDWSVDQFHGSIYDSHRTMLLTTFVFSRTLTSDLFRGNTLINTIGIWHPASCPLERSLLLPCKLSSRAIRHRPRKHAMDIRDTGWPMERCYR